jgi:hypothetical protein
MGCLPYDFLPYDLPFSYQIVGTLHARWGKSRLIHPPVPRLNPGGPIKPAENAHFVL